MRVFKKNDTATSEEGDMTLTELPATGIYTLIVFLSKEAYLNVGKLGTQKFPAGYYTYTGSAVGTGASSLKRRVSRHLKKRKQRFWHVDFLLADENATVTAVIAVQTNEKVECEMNCHIRVELGAKIPVVGFGASDCRENCGSHLLYFGEENIKPEIAALYTNKLRSEAIVVDLAENKSI